MFPAKSKTGFDTIFPSLTLPRNNFNSKINPTPLRSSVIPVNNSGLTLKILAEEIQKLFRLVAELELEILKVQGELENTQKSITAIEKELTSIQTTIVKLNSDVKTLQSSLTNLTKTVADQGEKITTLQNSLTNLTKTVADQGKEIAKLQTDLETLTGKLQKQQSELNTLKQTVTAQGETIADNSTAITQLQTDTTLLDVKTNFLDMIRETLSFLNDLNIIEEFVADYEQVESNDVDDPSDDESNWLQEPNDLQNKILFFLRYNQPSLFINLIISVLFRTVVSLQTDINFQGANSQVRYFSVNIFPISKISNNVPFYKYPNTNFWTVLTIDTRGPWVNKVKFFSFTPYLGQYNDGTTTRDYLANCNASISSTMIKANNPKIFSTERGKVYIFYTFNLFFAKLLHNPSKNRYAFVLPDMIDTSTFTIMTRFEKQQSVSTINFLNTIKAFTFSDVPSFIPSLESRNNVELVSPSTLKKRLDSYPVISPDYEKNKSNIDDFIALAKQYNTEYTPLKIFPYFYLSNKNKVVTNVYELIDNNSECNALYNDFNKNYYNSEIITIRDSDGNLLVKKFILIALNHVLSGYSTSNNIQIYNVKTQKSIQTISTSSELPFLSDDSSASTSYDVPQDKGLYTIEVDLTNEEFDGVNEIAFFERVCYPVAFTKSTQLFNSGPRYTSFTYNERARNENPSTDCTLAEVEAKNVYTIESKNPDYSLHLNYCKYSTLNFRAYSV